MGLFSRNKVEKGSVADIIECTKRNYLVWKWAPNGEASDNLRANSVRYGSKLRVSAGETAVFFYDQKDGKMVEFFKGPLINMTIETANMPVLSSIIGSAYGGGSPFSASVYFVNTSAANVFPFFIGNCEIVDERTGLSVPANVKGSVEFSIDDYEHFFNIHRFQDMDVSDLQDVVRTTVTSVLRPVIEQAPTNFGFHLLKIQANSYSICESASSALRSRLHDLAGVNFKHVNIESIAFDKEDENFKIIQERNLGLARVEQKEVELRASKLDADFRNYEKKLDVEMRNYDESLQIQRDTTRLAGQGANITAHQINVQGNVAHRAAESLGELGAGGGASIGGDGGMNMAGMMAGMMMGGAVGSNMANMMGNMTAGVANPVAPPPPPAAAISQYHVVINGQQMGPYTVAQLSGLVATGQFTRQTYVWKPGMANWDFAANIPELLQVFGAVPPPLPPQNF